MIMVPYVDVLTTPNALVDQLQIAARAGHCCYQSEGKTPLEAFLRRLVESGHESVLEHASISFRMVTNRAVTHQLVRHRIASYSQESMRYCKYKNQVVFIEPPIGTFANEEVRKVWVDSCREAAIRYQDLLEAGIRAEDARGVLPQDTKSEIYVTMNLREFRHFLKLRTSRHAQKPIRLLACRLHSWMKLNSFGFLIFDIEPYTKDL